MLKVLIVDDSFFLRAALKLQLKAIGCEVVGEAADLKEALERYTTLRPDVVTVDLILDPESGIQVTQQICEVDPKAKILIVSAVGQKKILEEAQKAGASGHVIKPVELSQLKEALEKINGGVL